MFKWLIEIYEEWKFNRELIHLYMKTMTKILISCGDSWPNGDFCWIDCEQPDYSQKEDRTHSYINTLEL